MSTNIVPFSIASPGFFGLNTQDSPVNMASNFALVATNCVIDKFGRVGARKGWEPLHTTNSDLGSVKIDSIGELISVAGVSTVLAAGNNKLFKLSGSTLVTLTYGGGGVAPTITASNWKQVMLNGAMLFFQLGHDPLLYDPALSTTEYRRLSEHPLYGGTAPLADAALSAYGRVWAANTSTDKQTVYWTDTLTYMKWTGGTSGSLNLYGVWPNGGDKIVAIGAHNGNLVIFGEQQILIYEGAENPAEMKLKDTISHSGCAGRDTVSNTPDDIIYLSESGVRSIKRLIQEKSAPMNVMSRNVNEDILGYLRGTVDRSTIKAVYSPSDNFYILTFTNVGITYCFDTKTPLEDGSSRVTMWSGIAPYSYAYTEGMTLLMGFKGYVGSHSSYLDNASTYRMSYYTPWLDFGDPLRTSILKKIKMTIFGAVTSNINFKWKYNYGSQGSQATPNVTDYGIPAEYDESEYNEAEYVSGQIVNELSVNASGSGKVIQIGFETVINNYPVSIQQVDVITKNGAYL